MLLDLCDPNPCLNGKCNKNATHFTCQCDPGYGGHVCQTRKSSYIVKINILTYCKF